MKLHYFNQPAADADDADLALAKQLEHVPVTCLLGGEIVMKSVKAERKPCDGCKGPRARCKGTPEREEGSDESFIRDLLTGSGELSVVNELLRKK